MATKDERKKAVAAFKAKVLRYLRREAENRRCMGYYQQGDVLEDAVKFVLSIDERDARTPGGLKQPRRRK